MDEVIWDDETGLQMAHTILELLPKWNDFMEEKITMNEVIATSPDPEKVRGLLSLLAVHIQKQTPNKKK